MAIGGGVAHGKVGVIAPCARTDGGGVTLDQGTWTRTSVAPAGTLPIGAFPPLGGINELND